MTTRLQRSLAYRLPRLYARILALAPIRDGAEKPVLPVTLLTFSGPEGIPLLRESLASLRRAWPRLPEVRIVSDGRLVEETVRRALSWWPGALTVVSWQDEASKIAGDEGELLRRFGKREVMGRKLAAILAGALRGPLVYTDTDVLWFRYPDRLDDLMSSGSEATLVVSRDFQQSYDEDLVPSRLPELASLPPACAGFLFAQGDLLDGVDFRDLLAFAADRGVGWTEQTLIAELARRLGNRYWPAQEVACLAEDRFNLRPSFAGRPWSARHYVTPARHLFWTDAFALRTFRRGPRP